MNWKDSTQAWNSILSTKLIWLSNVLFFELVIDLSLEESLKPSGWKRSNKLPYNNWSADASIPRLVQWKKSSEGSDLC